MSFFDSLFCCDNSRADENKPDAMMNKVDPKPPTENQLEAAAKVKEQNEAHKAEAEATSPQPHSPLSEDAPMSSEKLMLLENSLRHLFEAGDLDGNGVLDTEELMQLMSLARSTLRDSGLEFDEVTIESFINECDLNKDGVIDYEEFTPMMAKFLSQQRITPVSTPTATAEKTKVRCKQQLAAVQEAWATQADGSVDVNKYSPQVVERSLRMLFELFDKNHDGVLDHQELVQLLGVSGFEFDAEQVAALMAECDTNGDGVIDRTEFLPLMTRYFKGKQNGQSWPATASGSPQLATVPEEDK